MKFSEIFQDSSEFLGFKARVTGMGPTAMRAARINLDERKAD